MVTGLKPVACELRSQLVDSWTWTGDQVTGVQITRPGLVDPAHGSGAGKWVAGSQISSLALVDQLAKGP